MLSVPHVPEFLRRHWPAAPVLVCLFVSGCAASGALRRGDSAEHRQDYDLAVVEYTKALRLRPDDPEMRPPLHRAKPRGPQDPFLRGRRPSATRKLDQEPVEAE